MNDINYSMSILESYLKVEEFNKNIANKMFDFINNCYELEELSKHKYEIQKTLQLNKNYFQGYILDSDLCNYLKEYTTNNYSIEQLKGIIDQYENNSNEDLSSYRKAIYLYEQANDIEETIDNKIEYEMKQIYKYSTSIKDVENISQSEYEVLYNKIKNEITTNYLNQNYMDAKAFNICIQMLNDIFNYFISGYINIPEEYLNRDSN